MLRSGSAGERRLQPKGKGVDVFPRRGCSRLFFSASCRQHPCGVGCPIFYLQGAGRAMAAPQALGRPLAQLGSRSPSTQWRFLPGGPCFPLSLAAEGESEHTFEEAGREGRLQCHSAGHCGPEADGLGESHWPGELGEAQKHRGWPASGVPGGLSWAWRSPWTDWDLF